MAGTNHSKAEVHPSPQIAELLDALRAIAAREGGLPSERKLSDELGTNRYVLRQALAQLRKAGEIAPPKPRNIFPDRLRRVELLRHSNPVELWEIRLGFEPEIARLAAIRATPREIEALTAIHARADPGVFDLEADIAFHQAVAGASHNRMALLLIDLITDLTRDDTFRMQLPAFTDETGHRHHAEIAAAIAARRPAAAFAAMQQHHKAIHRWLIGFSDVLGT